MLREVLAEFRRTPRALCAGDVSHALGLDRGVVEGMLETLARTGRLTAVDMGDGCCSCPVRGGCMTIQIEAGKLYRLAESPEGARMPIALT